MGRKAPAVWVTNKKGILEEAKRKSDGVDKDFLKALARPEELDNYLEQCVYNMSQRNSDGTAHEQTDVEAMQESTDRCCAALVDLDGVLHSVRQKILHTQRRFFCCALTSILDDVIVALQKNKNLLSYIRHVRGLTFRNHVAFGQGTMVSSLTPRGR